MKNNCMTEEQSNCPYCSEKNGLRYYREGHGEDCYYCENCHRIVVWDGFRARLIDGEAYPNREKVAPEK